MLIPALTPRDRERLVAAGLIAFAEPFSEPTKSYPAPKVPRPSLPPGVVAASRQRVRFIVAPRVRAPGPLPSKAERRRLCLCLRCCRPAQFYGPEGGYGVWCESCAKEEAEKRATRKALKAGAVKQIR